MTSPVGGPAPRMPRAARHAQLVEVARRLVADRGAAAFTMEALAAEAGVNKAVVYRHFDNAAGVLGELWAACNADIAAGVIDAARADADDATRLAGIVAAYFDAVRQNADILPVLLAHQQSSTAGTEGGERIDIAFAAGVFERFFEVPPAECKALAAVATGSLAAAAESWARKEASRVRLERAVAAALVAAVEHARTAGSVRQTRAGQTRKAHLR